MAERLPTDLLLGRSFSLAPDLSAWLVVFDLDGTLIDSGLGICHAANQALALESRLLARRGGAAAPFPPLLPTDIGPPLSELIAKALGARFSSESAARCAVAFARLYDARASQAPDYLGAHDTLSMLASLGARMGLATNKRRAPTHSIVDERGWSTFFQDRLFALDDYPTPRSKASALVQMSGALSSRFSAMVGDSESDWQAALEARYDLFIFAPWGRADGWTPPISSLRVLSAGALDEIPGLLAP
jgi:phosphoglycolate phosphatase